MSRDETHEGARVVRGIMDALAEDGDWLRTSEVLQVAGLDAILKDRARRVLLQLRAHSWVDSRERRGGQQWRLGRIVPALSAANYTLIAGHGISRLHALRALPARPVDTRLHHGATAAVRLIEAVVLEGAWTPTRVAALALRRHADAATPGLDPRTIQRIAREFVRGGWLVAGPPNEPEQWRPSDRFLTIGLGCQRRALEIQADATRTVELLAGRLTFTFV